MGGPFGGPDWAIWGLLPEGLLEAMAIMANGMTPSSQGCPDGHLPGGPPEGVHLAPHPDPQMGPRIGAYLRWGPMG